MPEGTKVCKRCGKELPLSEFFPSSFMPDGYVNKCKSCMKNDRAGLPAPCDEPDRRKKKRKKPPITKRRGRPTKAMLMPPLKPIIEPPDGKERRAAWIEAHRQKGFKKK